MLREVGVRYGLHGASATIAKMNRIGSAWRRLERRTTTGSRRITGAWGSMTSAVTRSAAGLGLAVGGAAGAVTAAFVKIMKARAELTREQADLRALGMNDAEIAAIEARAGKLTKAFAGVSATGFTRAAYDVKSAMSELTAWQVAAVTATSAIMAKTTKMQQDGATALMGALYGASKQYFPKESAERFADRWAAGVFKTVQIFKATGPQIAAAAKNSVNVLASAGWNRAQMLGAWGSLITGGLSGEMAGTAMKQIAIKARSGFAKVAAAATGVKDKGVTAAFGAIGDKLWKKGPVSYFKALSKMMERLKAQGKDWKRILGSAFGEEPVNAVIAMNSKVNRLGASIRTVASASKEEMLGKAEQMNRGIGNQLDLLGQRWEWLKNKIGRIFEGVSVGWIDRLGRKFIAAADWIEARSDKFKQHFQVFAESFQTAFGSAFGGLPSVTASFGKLVEFLDRPDSAKWAKLGREIGRMAGVNLKDLISGLRLMRDALSAIWGVLGPIVSALWKVAKFSMKGWAMFGKHMAPDIKSYLGSPYDVKDENDFEAVMDRAASMPGLPGHPRTAPQLVTPPAISRGSGAVPPAGAPAAPAAPQPITVKAGETKVDVKVTLGMRELTDVITEVMKSEMDRAGLGHGDHATGLGYVF
jgi:TP901 family phage tail tape measure protein